MMTLADVQKRMEELKGWSIEGNALVKYFEFDTFKQGIDFINKVTEIAERISHHPDVLIVNKVVRLNLVTHSENSVTELDFDFAKEIDGIN